jgi:hypothetical protein
VRGRHDKLPGGAGLGRRWVEGGRRDCCRPGRLVDGGVGEGDGGGGERRRREVVEEEEEERQHSIEPSLGNSRGFMGRGPG